MSKNPEFEASFHRRDFALIEIEKKLHEKKYKIIQEFGFVGSLEL